MNKDAIIADINIHLMQANWWIASTLNGQAEDIEDAMRVARRHIHLAEESKELLYDESTD